MTLPSVPDLVLYRAIVDCFYSKAKRKQHQHSHVEEALRGLVVPPRMVGLLFFLLERLSIRQDYSGSHGISLPVDEFDCSRNLAHMVLFSHDDTMVRLVGENAYIRWMDDQIIGVQSRAEGLHVLSVIGKSLGRLHLAPNAKKSRILSLSEARRHFHLDLNGLLDKAEQISRSGMIRRLHPLLQRIWVKAQPQEGIGEFGKVLKRLYRLAGTANARFLRRRALKDVLSDPGLAERVCDYMRTSGSEAEYLNFVVNLMNADEQIYADVNVAAVEAFLRVEASGLVARRIRSLAVSLLQGKFVVPGAEECMAIAPLLILRFGDRRFLALLEGSLAGQKVSSALVLRSSAMASYGIKEFSAVRRAAGRLLRNPLASVVLLIERIREYDEVPGRYRNRLALRFDSVQKIKYIDMRCLLTARLLSLNRTEAVQLWLRDWKHQTLASSISSYDRTLLSRMLP
jgi:hypothetical protein